MAGRALILAQMPQRIKVERHYENKKRVKSWISGPGTLLCSFQMLVSPAGHSVKVEPLLLNEIQGLK